MNRLACVVIALAMWGCSNTARSVCAKANECCGTMSICQDINSQGPGWEDRCEIELNAQDQEWGTFGLDACNTIASKYMAYLGCLSGVQCSDVATSGHVVKCDAQAADYCNALKASGDACGQDYGHQGCDNYQASLDVLHLP